MKTFSRWVTFLVLVFAAASNAYAVTINVLWYSYADPASEYKAFFNTLATTGSPQPTGLTWNLTFFGPGDPPPVFSNYNLLVIHSGEAFRTGAPGQPNAIPDYSGIFANKAAIEAARGNRTIISGTDADFHAVRGDSGVCGTGSNCLDGALGYLINSVNWAAGGTNLGILSFVDGNFAGSFWWNDPRSFLASELRGYVTRFNENDAIITAAQAAFPMNQGLTSTGMSNWGNSGHAGVLKTIPRYTATVDSGSSANYALSLETELPVPPLTFVSASSRKAHGGTPFDIPIDPAGSMTVGQPITVEPRQIGAGFQIAFLFSAAPVSATVTTSSGSGTVAFSGKEAIVTLTGVADAARVQVDLTEVNGGTLSATARIGFLLGDVNGSRFVNSTDISTVKATSGAPLTASNFKSDLNVSGGINSTDILTVKASSGRSLP